MCSTHICNLANRVARELNNQEELETIRCSQRVRFAQKVPLIHLQKYENDSKDYMNRLEPRSDHPSL